MEMKNENKSKSKRVRVAEGIYTRIDAKNELTYIITYRDISKKLKFETVGKKRDGIGLAYCKQFRSKRINEVRLGEDVAKHRKKITYTVNDIAQEYIEYTQAMHKDKRGPNQRYRDHIKPFIANRDVDSITQDDVENIVKRMMRNNYMPATIERVRQTISAIFSLANYKDKCKLNPAKISRNDKISILRRNKQNINNARERYLTKQEIQILLSELQLHRFDIYCMSLLALTTGARSGEILKIQYKHIDYENAFITLVETKNGTNKKIKLPPITFEAIKKLGKRSKNDYLFLAQSKKPFTKIPAKFFSIVNRLFNDGLDSKDSRNRVVFHTLRHTFASQLVIEGVPILEIQKLIGHKDMTQTLRYAKLSQDLTTKAVFNLEAKIISTKAS